MLLRFLVYTWLGLTLFFAWEYAQLHGLIAGPGILEIIFCDIFDACDALDPQPGRILSYTLGWVGFGIMCLTNIYVIRKRFHSMAKFGKLQHFLDWHIFFGLLGPTLIVFHCDFEVRGLVAISFWSMVISFLSGVVGRYFYLQLLQRKSYLKRTINLYEQGFNQYLKVSGNAVQKKHMDLAKAHIFTMSLGGVGIRHLQQVGIVGFLYHSLKGDLNLYLNLPHTPWPGGKTIRRKLREWALLRRRLIFMHYYNLMFGYWRTFHTPFAVFMYIVAIIHIISSLIFKTVT
jgi:hypothetical protein